MPFNYNPTQSINYMPISSGIIEQASKNPFQIAGQAMDGLTNAIEDRIFEKKFAQAKDLNELASLTPRTAQQAQLVGSRANMLNAINAQAMQERQFGLQQDQFGLQQDQLEETKAQNFRNSLIQGKQYELDESVKNQLTIKAQNENKLFGEALNIYNDKTKYNSLDADSKFQVDKILGIAKQEFAQSTSGLLKPTDVYKPMTNEEIKNYNLDPTKSYQINLAGQVKEVGESGQKITVAKQKEQEMGKYISEKAIEDVNAMRAQLSSGTVGQTGISGGLMSALGKIGLQSDRTRLEGYRDSLKASLSLDALKAMKAASPTGGSGLGSVTEAEHKLLQEEIASLDFSQPDDKIQQSLNNIEYKYRLIVDGKTSADEWKKTLYIKKSPYASKKTFDLNSTLDSNSSNTFDLNITKKVSPKEIGF